MLPVAVLPKSRFPAPFLRCFPALVRLMRHFSCRSYPFWTVIHNIGLDHLIAICRHDICQGISQQVVTDVTQDTQAGMIYAYLEDYTGDRVCSKQLYEEALGNLNSPADWETRAICEIMNTGIAGGIIQGLAAYKSPKRYKKYGSQKGWERVNQAPPEGDGFKEITEEEARQMELPF